MENSQSTYLLDGIQIHSCKYCRRIVFDYKRCLRNKKAAHEYYFSARYTEMAASDGCELFRRERYRVRRAIASASNPCLAISPFLDKGEAYLLFDWKDGDVDIYHVGATDWQRIVFVPKGIHPVLSESSLHRTLNISQKVPLHRTSGSGR